MSHLLWNILSVLLLVTTADDCSAGGAGAGNIAGKARVNAGHIAGNASLNSLNSNVYLSAVLFFQTFTLGVS